MERLCIEYCCKNKKNHSCDFSFRGFSTFVASGIMPKDAERIALFLLNRKNDKRIMKDWNKLQKDEKSLEKYQAPNTITPETYKEFEKIDSKIYLY